MSIVSEETCVKSPAELSFDSEYPWYAVRVRTGAETRIMSLIENRGVRVYLPSRVEVRRYSDRVKKVPRALFPGYLFCSLEFRRRVTVLELPCVEYFLTVSGEPQPIPTVQLEFIRKMLASGLPLFPFPYVKNGDPIRVCSGPLSGVEGTLVKVNQNLRLVVSVHLLQRSMLVEVDSLMVTPLHNSTVLSKQSARNSQSDSSILYRRNRMP